MFKNIFCIIASIITAFIVYSQRDKILNIADFVLKNATTVISSSFGSVKGPAGLKDVITKSDTTK